MPSAVVFNNILHVELEFNILILKLSDWLPDDGCMCEIANKITDI